MASGESVRSESVRSRLRLCVIGLVVCVCGALLFAGPARAATGYDSNVVVFTAGSPDPSTFVFLGKVESDRRACLGKRKVQIIVKVMSGKRRTFDVARTSDNGGWYAAGPLALIEKAAHIRITALKRTIKHKGKRIVCRRDSPDSIS